MSAFSYDKEGKWVAYNTMRPFFSSRIASNYKIPKLSEVPLNFFFFEEPKSLCSFPHCY